MYSNEPALSSIRHQMESRTGIVLRKMKQKLVKTKLRFPTKKYSENKSKKLKPFPFV